MWLLKSETAARLEQFSRASFVPTAEQLRQFAARAATRGSSEDEGCYVVAGNVAQITIAGVLTEQPDFWAWLLGIGNTAYADVRDAFALAEADPTVKQVSLRVASPGGHVDGLFETLAAIQAFSKPISVVAAMACSAAYALAAVAGKIQATGPAAEFGSIGVACSFAFDADTEIVDVTSTEAPDKRPDPRTPEGKAVVVGYLDAVHELFADAIAQGRGTTVPKVNAGFGRGASMLAGAAKAAGMIDSIASQPSRSKSKSKAESAAGPLTARALELCEQAPPIDQLLTVASHMPQEGTTPTARKPTGDLGDEVWLRFEAHRAGKSIAELTGFVAGEPEQPDMGDKIVANMDAVRAGKPPPYPPVVESHVLPSGTDLSDLVADLICGIDLKKVG